ncbi:HutD family protein [Flavobacterium sp. AC]|uniref:HutD family protein n=1 Tax=Flavobacterium azizsancarii TaxID=2961580 RepID=A0ABT4WCJ6_9FLAO|nr:HutD family protein [Flavobacterium azizsancarii]MDA6069834.1 HutD family protein [Flavobacterium azizsancarii]
MNIRLLPKKDSSASIWGGGLTYEYIIYPETAKYSDRDFIFRISSATIEKVPSEFTKFKGYYRYLVMLDNYLDIELNKEKKRYEKYEIIEFNSADEVTSYTKGTDFNWMVSEKVSNHKLKITNGNQNYNAEIIILFSLHTTIIKINEKLYDLEPHDLLVIENQKKENIVLDFSNECLCGILDF